MSNYTMNQEIKLDLTQLVTATDFSKQRGFQQKFVRGAATEIDAVLDHILTGNDLTFNTYFSAEERALRAIFSENDAGYVTTSTVKLQSHIDGYSPSNYAVVVDCVQKAVGVAALNYARKYRTVEDVLIAGVYSGVMTAMNLRGAR